MDDSPNLPHRMASSGNRIGRRFPHVIVRALVAAGMVFLLPAGESYGTPDLNRRLEDVMWGNLTSWIEPWAGGAVFAASFEGSNRPYELRQGRVEPLFSPSQTEEWKSWHFYRPVALSPESLLLVGRPRSAVPNDDLFLFHRTPGEKAGIVTNLTNTPESSESDPCIHESTRTISYRLRDGEQMVGSIEDSKLTKIRAIPAQLKSCAFVSGSELLGLTDERVPGLIYCLTSASEPSCRRTAALKDLEEPGSLQLFEPSARVLIARKIGEPFRRPWKLASDFESATPLLSVNPTADILQAGNDELRISLLSLHSARSIDRVSELPRAGEGIITFVTKAGGDVLAAYSDPLVPRTLARREGEKWRPLELPGMALLGGKDAEQRGIRLPREIWIRYDDAKVVQSYYFGSPDPQTVVMWWHGGPKENVSPRYQPYFHLLNQYGIGVLAINYPGSTGRGAPFESETGVGPLDRTFRSSIEYLRANGVRKIVSWSVSNGARLHLNSLRRAVPISGVIDQVSNREMRPLVDALNLPYFSIRGRFDKRSDQGPVDFLYDDGHDITEWEDFKKLAGKVLTFIDGLPELPSYPPPEGKNARIVLDLAPASSGGEEDPHTDYTFELATEMSRLCLPWTSTVFSRDGSEPLQSAANAEKAREQFLDVHALLPRLTIRLTSMRRDSFGAGKKGATLVTVPAMASDDERKIADSLRKAIGGTESTERSPDSGHSRPRGCRSRVDILIGDRKAFEEKSFDIARGVFVRPAVQRLAEQLCAEADAIASCPQLR